MALKTETIGTEASQTHRYTWRDTVLYALGVGARRETDLDFLYEGRGPKVLPTYAAVPIFEVFRELLVRVKGDLDGVVHGAQTLRFHRPLESTGELTTTGRVVGLYDLKRMATGTFAFELHDASGALIAEAEADVVFLKEGDFGGERPPRRERIAIVARKPDFSVSERTTTEQALLYRLSSDLNPLHADPEVAEGLGFDVPILHGLATFGIIGRTVVRELCDQDPSRLKALSGQFRAAVRPGNTLTVQGWRHEGRVILSAGTQEHPEDLCFTNAHAEVGARTE